ncbi:MULTISPECIES: zinc ribbon domain-containing protein [Bacillales]|uniref:zinc ribbon domain-containing protein n=1 Tax=Bacillales TaxID=1385 RepID=UPI0009E4E1B0|nr:MULTISPECIES: zinc ribbon domain-containing protein [Bacillales]
MNTIECPWCSSVVQLDQNVCPACKHEVLAQHLDTSQSDVPNDHFDSEIALGEFDLASSIANKFECSKCKNTECEVDEIAMTGAGLSKLLNIQYHLFLYVSCLQCGLVEIYNPNMLHNK